MDTYSFRVHYKILILLRAGSGALGRLWRSGTDRYTYILEVSTIQNLVLLFKVLDTFLLVSATYLNFCEMKIILALLAEYYSKIVWHTEILYLPFREYSEEQMVSSSLDMNSEYLYCVIHMFQYFIMISTSKKEKIVCNT